MLSGRARPHAVLPRLAPAAVRPGRPDLHAGDAADAVLDMGRICRGPDAAGPRRRRPGDGRRHCRHHRRYQDAAEVDYRTANGAWYGRPNGTPLITVCTGLSNSLPSRLLLR